MMGSKKVKFTEEETRRVVTDVRAGGRHRPAGI